MQTVINFTKPTSAGSNQRQTIMEIITSELYPEESFPAKYFPNLHTLLINHFIEIIKPQDELWKLYNSDQESIRIKETVRQTLSFRNILKNHPRTVVLIYREYIKKFLIFKNAHADPAEREDIFQEILARLIEDKIYKIQEKYDFNFHKISSFTSYFMVTVRNIYIDIIRERNVRPLTAGGVQEIGDVADGFVGDPAPPPLHDAQGVDGEGVPGRVVGKFGLDLVSLFGSQHRLPVHVRQHVIHGP